MDGEAAPGGRGMSLGSYLRLLRDSRGLTLRQIEARCGVCNPYISQLEQDRGKLASPRILRALADCYGVDWLELMRLTSHPVPPGLDGAGSSTATFVGAEHLTPEERDEIQAMITRTLRRREGAQWTSEPERLRAPA